MKPTIIFNRAAPMYEASLIKYGKEYVMPSDELYEQKIEVLKKNWSEWGPRILDKLYAITKLEWQDKDIRCYIVSGTKASFSHPLTLKVYDSDEQMFDTFVHELLHRLLHSPEHPERIREARRKLVEPHEGESKPTKNHIVLHALHAQLVLELFGQERLDRIRSTVRSHDYLRAWQIVDELGRERVLKEVFGYIQQ